MQIDLSKEVLTRLDALAAKLGVTVDYLWRVLVQQARVEAIQAGVFMVGAVLVFTLGMWLFKWGVKKMDTSADDGACAGIFFGIGLGLFAIISFLISLQGLPTKIFNPEYWAFREVMRLLGR